MTDAEWHLPAYKPKVLNEKLRRTARRPWLRFRSTPGDARQAPPLVDVILEDRNGNSADPIRTRTANGKEDQHSSSRDDAEPAQPAPASILVAGMGNVFLGDDAFGVEVIKRFVSQDLPDGVRVIDFGIRAIDLAAALAEGPEYTIFVDSCPQGGAAGNLYVLEPDLNSISDRSIQPASDGCPIHPLSVIRAAQSLGVPLRHILLLGCEPLSLGSDEGHVGLSEPVAAAVERAVPKLGSLVKDILLERRRASSAGT